MKKKEANPCYNLSLCSPSYETEDSFEAAPFPSILIGQLVEKFLWAELTSNEADGTTSHFQWLCLVSQYKTDGQLWPSPTLDVRAFSIMKSLKKWP